MKWMLVLHFLLNGHVHTVPVPALSFDTETACKQASIQAKSYLNLRPGETVKITCEKTNDRTS
jgi:hypothetical protein